MSYLRSSVKRWEFPEGSLWRTVLKQAHVWQRRFYDFVVWNRQKRGEKLRYMHENPVRRGLVACAGGVALEQFPRLCGSGTGARVGQ